MSEVLKGWTPETMYRAAKGGTFGRLIWEELQAFTNPGNKIFAMQHLNIAASLLMEGCASKDARARAEWDIGYREWLIGMALSGIGAADQRDLHYNAEYAVNVADKVLELLRKEEEDGEA